MGFGEEAISEQTYVYSDSGKFYESHLSLYTKIDKLDITPGTRVDPGQHRCSRGKSHVTARSAGLPRMSHNRSHSGETSSIRSMP